MSEMISYILPLLFLALFLLFVVRLLANAMAPVKQVKATVTDKHKEELFSKYSGNGKRERFVVVFSASGKTLSFQVSEFSYEGYAVNETGTLTYRGNRIISFD